MTRRERNFLQKVNVARRRGWRGTPDQLERTLLRGEPRGSWPDGGRVLRNGNSRPISVPFESNRRKH